MKQATASDDGATGTRSIVEDGADDGSAAFGLHNGRYPFRRNEQLSATVDVHVKKVRE
jgi:hypothetical protein